MLFFVFFFFKQKTAYEMRISDWSSDVCSSDLHIDFLLDEHARAMVGHEHRIGVIDAVAGEAAQAQHLPLRLGEIADAGNIGLPQRSTCTGPTSACRRPCHSDSNTRERSEEHTSELQSLMRISYAVFCLKKKIQHKNTNNNKDKTKDH